MVVDHGTTMRDMKEVAISEFKAEVPGHAGAGAEDTQADPDHTLWEAGGGGDSSIPRERTGRKLGSMIGTAKIGDIAGPTGSWDDWEASR